MAGTMVKFRKNNGMNQMGAADILWPPNQLQAAEFLRPPKQPKAADILRSMT